MAPTLQRICGTIYFPEDSRRHLAVAALQGDLYGISDGSVRGKASMHAWKIKSMGDQETLTLKGSGPVDGTACTISLYRVELQGQLAILIVITLVIKTFAIKDASITSACDNQSVLI